MKEARKEAVGIFIFLRTLFFTLAFASSFRLKREEEALVLLQSNFSLQIKVTHRRLTNRFKITLGNLMSKNVA